MTEDILEALRINRIAKHFLRAPHQFNKIHEADAELVDLGDSSENYLAVTTDALVEEVASGLYDNPHLIGWMLATVNFSDLAAVGADPLGLLIALSFPPTQGEEFMARLSGGISDACRQLRTFVLGGDTNEGSALFLSGCAVGLVPKEACLTRIGAKQGDKLYLSAAAGLGSAYGFLKLFKPDDPIPEEFYRPRAKLDEGKILRAFASCCMDTSDGVLYTVDTLMRLNRCRIVLDDDWEKVIHPLALRVCREQKLPPWLALASVHGEFELCFTIPPEQEKSFSEEAAKNGWHAVLIGEVIEGQGVSIRTKGRLVPIPTGLIRNLSETASSDPREYIRQLFDLAGRTEV